MHLNAGVFLISYILIYFHTEIKPPINQLFIFNGNCLRWTAEKYEEATEVYKVRRHLLLYKSTQMSVRNNFNHPR